ncbi:hypothetical protein GCM10027072_24210 [Streptomyces bullii]
MRLGEEVAHDRGGRHRGGPPGLRTTRVGDRLAGGGAPCGRGRRTGRSGSGPVLLAVVTAALCAWLPLPLAFLAPGRSRWHSPESTYAGATTRCRHGTAGSRHPEAGTPVTGNTSESDARTGNGQELLPAPATDRSQWGICERHGFKAARRRESS